jgi:hypothetical protein
MQRERGVPVASSDLAAAFHSSDLAESHELRHLSGKVGLRFIF